jgi:hypothetical protein
MTLTREKWLEREKRKVNSRGYMFDFTSVTNDLVEICRKKQQEAWKRGDIGKFTYWLNRGSRYGIMQLEYERESGRDESSKTL